jgi:hypothetical protein
VTASSTIAPGFLQLAPNSSFVGDSAKLNWENSAREGIATELVLPAGLTRQIVLCRSRHRHG